MDFSNVLFRRKFSMTMYKDLKLALGKMTFTKDFVNDKRGDLYPILEKSADCEERIEDNLYQVHAGTVKRWFCQFFPYATYEVSVREFEGNVGFSFAVSGAEASVTWNGSTLLFACGDVQEQAELPKHFGTCQTMMVSVRPGAFDVFFEVNGSAKFCHTFTSEAFQSSNEYARFQDGYAALSIFRNAVIESVSAYIDCGVSQADIRPIRYENGEIMVEHGKVYLTASIRMQVEMFQGVFSWIPGTAEFELTGALFYDAGDGKWCGDVAASVLYVRDKKMFYLWVCSFNHGHILGHAAFDGDLRFGVNVVDITLMEKAPEGADVSVFAGMQDDEDPDFSYDEERKKWMMAICRKDRASQSYRYVFLESEQPFDGYQFIGQGLPGQETGGSFVRVNGEQLFVCGNDFHAVSNYRIYDKNGMQNAVFDYPDGGFRGWGTLIPVKVGSRTRYFWLTFDRHNGSSYNWSYGNIYCFEMDGI